MIQKKQVDELETIMGQLRSIHAELTALSKKSPHDAVNKFKLEFVNTVIERCNRFLGEGYRPFKKFGTFEADEVMSNSDVTFMVSLYLEAIEKYRSDHVKFDAGEWCYDLPEGQRMRAAPPARIRLS